MERTLVSLGGNALKLSRTGGANRTTRMPNGLNIPIGAVFQVGSSRSGRFRDSGLDHSRVTYQVPHDFPSNGSSSSELVSNPPQPYRTGTRPRLARSPLSPERAARWGSTVEPPKDAFLNTLGFAPARDMGIGP